MLKYFFLSSLLFTVYLVTSSAIGKDAGKISANKNKLNALVLPLNNWASQRVISKALGTIIQSLGKQVEYKNISSTDQWGALRKGLIHIQLEVWQVSMAKEFNRMVLQNHIIDAGTHKAKGKEDWWYPDYVEELCPGLPDWQAMNACSEIFSTASSHGKGVYYAGPWDYGDGDIIRALNLNFTIHRFENDTQVWQQLAHAINMQQPIMLLNWTPNWTDSEIKGKFVKFPAYHPDCETKANWGLNKHRLKDCANPSNGWLKKAVWPQLESNYPCVFQLVKNINLSTTMIADASALRVVNNHSEEQAAKIWLKKYQKHVRKWLPASCEKADIQV